MSFRLVLKSVTLNDLERRKGPYFASGAHSVKVVEGVIVKKSSHSLSHLLMSFLYVYICCLVFNQLHYTGVLTSSL